MMHARIVAMDSWMNINKKDKQYYEEQRNNIINDSLF